MAKETQEFRDRKQKRRIVRRLCELFKVGENSVPLIKKIVETGYGKVRFGDEYIEMLAWCDLNKQKPTHLRYNNWIKKRMQWDKEKRDNTKDTNFDLDKYERDKTKRLLEQYR